MADLQVQLFLVLCAAVCSPTTDCADKGGYCTKGCSDGQYIEGLCKEDGCKCCFEPGEYRRDTQSYTATYEH